MTHVSKIDQFGDIFVCQLSNNQLVSIADLQRLTKLKRLLVSYKFECWFVFVSMFAFKLAPKQCVDIDFGTWQSRSIGDSSFEQEQVRIC